MESNPHITSIKDISLEPAGAVFPSPENWRDHFIYFLLVDRFDDHRVDPPPYDEKTTPIGRNAERSHLFQGGTLKGITRRLDYIQGTGATAIWISPIIKNRMDDLWAASGYGIQDFLSVDPRYGTLADMQELVREAHARGLYVILDTIINHTGNNWAYKDDHEEFYNKNGTRYDFGFWRVKDPTQGIGVDDAVWPVEFQNPDWYKRRGKITNWDDAEEAVHGDFESLKELDLGRGDVLEAIITCYKYWIAATDVDGFRLDTVKHLEDGAAARFATGVKEYAERIGKKNFFVFGEVVGDDNTIRKYVLPQNIGQGGERRLALDACLDFPLYFILEEVIKQTLNPALLRDRYDRLRYIYPDNDVSEYFVTFVDNHDQMSRPHRRFLCNAASPKQAILAVGYLLTSQGIPCMYYGTEQGFNGGGDTDWYVRECMFGGTWGAFETTGAHFFNPEHPLYKEIANVAALRKAEPALRFGRQYFREISTNLQWFSWPALGFGSLAFARVLDSDELIVVMNLSGTSRADYITVDTNLTPPKTFVINLLHKENTPIMVEDFHGRAYFRVPLDPYEIAVFKNLSAI